jgi:hypothetical protein
MLLPLVSRRSVHGHVSIPLTSAGSHVEDMDTPRKLSQ